MQLVPTISQDLYDALGAQTQRPDVLIEFYENDALPGVGGFDPADSIFRVASRTLTFLGESYTCYLEDLPTINRTITEKFNTVSIKLSNTEEPSASGNRPVAAFVLGNPVEGMFVVIRLVSRAFTATGLDDSFVVFTGKLEKPFDAESNSITLTAKQYIGSVDEQIPWREFDPEDEEGRLTTDILFEGFLFSAKNGFVAYRERVRRGGFLGLLGFKKTVSRTLQFSNHQGVEIAKVVPLILGRAQVPYLPVAYIDAGGQINTIYCISEGPIKKFGDRQVMTSGFEFASVADNNPEVDQFRFGYPGNTNGQVPFVDNLTGGIPGNGYYSMSAMMSTALYGTEVSQDDPAPEVIGVILGMLMALPNASGGFIFEDWSDNPAFHVRWALTHPRVFNLDPAFINDPQCIKTACYCDDPVLDETNGELILLTTAQEASYGTAFRRYHSTSLFTPQYFKHYFLNDGQDPLPELILPSEDTGIVNFYDPAATTPTIDTLPLVRRRFTSNIYLNEKTKTIDFLFEVLLPTFRGFLVQNAQGKIDIKCRRPGDNTIIRSAVSVTDEEVAVNTILPWVASLSGQVIIGTDLLTSEVRTVIGTRYSSVANSITLAVSGSLTASGATLTGGDDNNPATGSVTVTGIGTLTVTIDGHSVSYTTASADNTSTAAAMLTQFLKADLTFQTYLKFTWSPATPTVISIQSKLGFLELDSPLEEDHDIAEEVLRIQMSFSDRLYTPADRLNSNIIKDSFQWPLGGRRSSVNQIVGTFTDSPQDFAAQKLRTLDKDHRDQVKKKLPEELGLTGVDNFSQAKRLELSKLAELRDLDFFMQHTSDRRAMLLEEGDLICNTHASGGFRNVALRVEEVTIDLSQMTVNILARRYSTSAYSDVAPARNVPLPTTLLGDAGPPDIQFNEAEFPFFGLTQTTDGVSLITSVRGGAIFGASVFAQKAKVSLKRPSETEFTQIFIIEPDSELKAEFEFIASVDGLYTVQLEVCFDGGICNTVKPTASIVVGFGSLFAIAKEGGVLFLKEGSVIVEKEHA